MKKPSLRSYSTRRDNRGGIIIAGVLALVLVVIAALRFAAPSMFVSIASPLWRVGTMLSASVGASTEGLTSSANLAKQRDTLAQENEALTAQNRALAAQVHDLQNLLGSRTAPAPGILASVIARPPVAPYDVLIIDQGASAHISLGATALGPGGTPIGTVASVQTNSARITLYSNPGLQTEAWAGDTRVPVTLTGIGSGAFEATLPKAAGIQEGQGIFVASAGAVPVGVVTKIDSDPSSPNVTLHIRPYVNPFSLTWVTVSQNGV